MLCISGEWGGKGKEAGQSITVPSLRFAVVACNETMSHKYQSVLQVSPTL